MRFEPGERVRHIGLSRPCFGTVREDDGNVVWVAWDDGKIGILYRDDGMIPNVRYLEALSEAEGNKERVRLLCSGAEVSPTVN